ncbi:hypothetical protein HDV02_002845 [Globomyces sp. JEL0801]|nr:hypothetical protein HDV02_002845 [Globomyces sp. JEL0801]
MLVFLFLLAVSEAKSFCPLSNQFCISSSTGASDTQLCFTVHSANTGWAAMGVGSKTMTNSDMYMGWKNSTGGITLSNRAGGGYFLPPVNSQQNGILVPLIEAQPDWSKLSFSFCRSVIISTNGKSITPLQVFSYASAKTNPTTNVDSISASFSKHSSAGNFKFDFTIVIANQTTNGTNTSGLPTDDQTNSQPLNPTDSTTSDSSSGTSMKTVILAHAVLMFIAWAVAPFIGIFIARYLKGILGHHWFKLHILFMGPIVFGCTLAGFITVNLYFTISDDNKSHAIIGWILIVGTFVQVILGIICDRLFSMERTSIPWWDVLHWWWGRSLMVLGLVNVYLGKELINNLGYDGYSSFNNGFWVMFAMGIAAFGVAEYKIEKVHDGKVHDGAANSKNL